MIADIEFIRKRAAGTGGTLPKHLQKTNFMEFHPSRILP